MQSLLICFVVFTFTLPSVLSIECFACETNHENNMTCADSLVLTNCEHHPEGSRMDSCYTFTFTLDNVTEVHRNCSIQSRCSDLEQMICSSLKGSGATFCELECCEGERCNAAQNIGHRGPKIDALHSKSSLQAEHSSLFVVFLLLVTSYVCFA